MKLPLGPFVAAGAADVCAETAPTIKLESNTTSPDARRQARGDTGWEQRWSRVGEFTFLRVSGA